MKTKTSLIALFIFTFILILNTSCGNSNKILKFDSESVEKTFFLFEKDTLGPRADIEILITYPTDFYKKESLKTLQTLFTSAIFEMTVTEKDNIKSILSDYVDTYYNEWIEYATEFNDFEDVPAWSFSSMLNLDNEIEYFDKNILSFTVEQYSYTGGSHGSSSKGNYTIDLNGLFFISEEDIFIKEYQDILKAALLKALIKELNFNSIEELRNSGYYDTDNILPNNNFFITNKGITYTFNEYEIASYSRGKTTLFIPFSEIKSVIKPESVVAKLIVNK